MVIPRLSHLHLQLNLIVRRILPWSLTIWVTLSVRWAHLIVSDVVIATIDCFFGLRRNVSSSQIRSCLGVTLVILVVSLVFLMSLFLSDRVDGVRKILLLHFLMLHVFLQLLPVWIDEGVIDSFLVHHF